LIYLKVKFRYSPGKIKRNEGKSLARRTNSAKIITRYVPNKNLKICLHINLPVHK